MNIEKQLVRTGSEIGTRGETRQDLCAPLISSEKRLENKKILIIIIVNVSQTKINL